MRNKRKSAWFIVIAFIASFVLQVLRENFQRERSLEETFSRWEWATNFFLYWLMGFIACSVILLGIQKLEEKYKRSNQEHH